MTDRLTPKGVFFPAPESAVGSSTYLVGLPFTPQTFSFLSPHGVSSPYGFSGRVPSVVPVEGQVWPRSRDGLESADSFLLPESDE